MSSHRKTDSIASSSSGSPQEREFEEINLDVFMEALEEGAFIPQKEAEVLLHKEGKADFLRKVESYYSHKQLVDALLVKGEIPHNPVESTVGIGFLDIVNYSYLSKWLSPKENQLILNGLYAAFAHVIKKNGGFLNKIEGDSLMFHFGGNIDPEVAEKSQSELNNYLAKNLFYTCVEVQRTCQDFNEANKDFLDQNCSKETKESIQEAFSIISNLRMNLALASGVNAKFQIKIRIGASIGEVSIGNFGPRGKKQWDIIGEPVIEAKRMEMSAPVGGLRISEKMYRLLEKGNYVQVFHDEFKRRALEQDGKFSEITEEELFSYKEVVIENKNGVHFQSYSVQVSSRLPENVAAMVISFLELGEEGADEILDLLQYYRGSRLVIDAVEEALVNKGISLNKIELLRIISPKKFGSLNKDNHRLYDKAMNAHYSLYGIFSLLGAHQDRIEKDIIPSGIRYMGETDSATYLERKREELLVEFKYYEKKYRYKVYFDKVTFPLIFRSIKSDILDFQNKLPVTHL
jgi:adenylate cyclase